MSETRELKFEDICRACLSEGDLQPIFEYITVGDSTIKFSDMLMACASVEVIQGDGFPSQLCRNCIYQVNQAYNFKLQCEKSDTKMRENSLNVIQNSPVRDNTEAFPPVDDFDQKDYILNDEIVKTENACEETNNESYENLSINGTQRRRVKKVKVQYQRKHKMKRCRKMHSTEQGTGYQCKKCSEKFETSQELHDHYKSKRHPMRRDHECNICHKFFTSSQLGVHMRSHTNEKPFTCEVCGQQFSLNCNLRRHMMLHTGEKPKKHVREKPFTCQYCGQQFSFNCNLRRHMMTHTGERPHQCQLCGKGFIQSIALANHMRTHTGETPFICNICGKGFRQAERLRHHVKLHSNPNASESKRKNASHTSERSHICDICNKGYYSKGALKTHLLSHGDKSFLCSECGKGFVSNAGLQSHSKIHTGEKPYDCDVCGKKFSHSVSLKLHTLVHTGEKPFSCSICKKVFTQRPHLKYHMRTHSGEKPYSCSVCSKSFSLNCNLTVHMRQHSGETPYICPVCGKGFYDSSSMKKHHKGHGISNILQNENIFYIKTE